MGAKLSSLLLISLLLTLLGTRPAHALKLDPTSFRTITNDMLSDLGAFVGLGADLHAYEGAVPFSSNMGIDVGVSATAIQIPGSVTRALTNLGIPNIPHYFPLPKINVQKKLPGRLMIGSEVLPTIKIGGNKISIYGFDMQWTAVDRPRLPPIAIRAQFNYSSLVFVSAATYGGDLLTTYKLGFVHVFGGAGYRYVTAKISNPTSTMPSIPGINLDQKIDAGHFFSGITLDAGFARLTAEADITTRKVNTYGTKLCFYF